MEEIKIRDTCNVLNGYAFKSDKYVNEGIRVIRITNVQKGYIEDYKPQYYPLSEYENLKDYTLFENDILISLTGNVGRIAMVTSDFLPALLNQRVACLRVKNNNVDYRYLYYYLLSSRFEKDCVSSAKGIAQKNLSTEWLKEYQINIYPKDKQKEIIKVLDKLTRMISSRKQQLQQLDELVKSRFVEMFGDPALNQYNWDVVPIKDIVTDVRYGTSRPATDGGKYPYLRMNNLTYDGHLDLSDLKYIDIPENEIEKSIVRKGDVLFNRTNSIELVGKTCVFDLEEDMVIAGYIIRVRLNSKVLPVVLSSYMNSTVLKDKLRNMAKGAVNQANINAQELQSIKVYLPPLNLQNKFANFVKQIDKSKFCVINYLRKIQLIKGELL